MGERQGLRIAFLKLKLSEGGPKVSWWGLEKEKEKVGVLAARYSSNGLMPFLRSNAGIATEKRATPTSYGVF